MAKSRVLGLALLLIIGLLSMSSAAASDYVYQEMENATACEGTWAESMPCGNALDGDWSTAAITVDYGTVAKIYINYTKYPGSNSESAVKCVGANQYNRNYSIPLSCWNANQNVISLELVSDATATNGIYNQLNCWNGQGYIQIFKSYAGVHIDDARIFEAAMNWRLTPLPTYVYQEKENTTLCSGTWYSTMPCSNTYDGDGNTAGRTSGMGTASKVYVSYTKYPGSTVDSMIRYNGAYNDYNQSIHAACWNANPTILMFELISNASRSGTIHNQLSCWNGSTYAFITKSYEGPDISYSGIYDTAMNWVVSTTTTVPSVISLERILPETATNSSNITVKISMVVTSLSQASVGVTETFPSGWSLLNVSLGGIQRNNTIEWLFWPFGYPVKSQNITYNLLVPSTALGIYSFDGTLSLGNGTYVNTQGDGQITIIAGCTLTGDYPPCETVTLDEVVSYINLWAAGQAKLSNVVALIIKWMAS